MATTLRTQSTARPAESFDSLNPATSEVIATFGVFSEDDVAQTVERAHEAASWWASLSWAERRTRLLAWKSYLTRYIGRLAELFPAGSEVTPESLVAGGAVRRGELVKVLGDGDLAVALRVSAHAVSGSARQKIEAAGGTVTLLG